MRPTTSITLALLALAACAPTPHACVPGSTQACLCADLTMSAQVCDEDGARWLRCQCEGHEPDDAGGGGSVDGGGGGHVDSGGGGTDAGPGATCMPPGPHGEALLVASSGSGHPHARLEFASNGLLTRIDGTACALAADQTPSHGMPPCFDRYTSGACTIEIATLDTPLLTGTTCPEYAGTYSLCNLTSSCDGASCGEDSCGVSCGPDCTGGDVCTAGVCGPPPACPPQCMSGSDCCMPPFCAAGFCAGTFGC